MSLKHERKAYAKLDTPNGVVYMVTPTLTLGRGPASVDVPLPGDTSISRLHARIDFLPDLQHFEVRVLGKNGIFVDGSFLRAGDKPKVLRSHTDLIIGRGSPQLLTFYLPAHRPSGARPPPKGGASSKAAPASAPASMLSLVGQVLIAADAPLDAGEIYARVVSLPGGRAVEMLASGEAVRASVRAAVEGNAHIFEVHPAYDMDARERIGDPGRKAAPRTHAAFSVREMYRLRFLKARKQGDGDVPMPDAGRMQM